MKKLILLITPVLLFTGCAAVLEKKEFNDLKKEFNLIKAEQKETAKAQDFIFEGLDERDRKIKRNKHRSENNEKALKYYWGKENYNHIVSQYSEKEDK